MNPLLTLIQQPNQVLVALFNCIAFKKLKNGQVNPLCVNICKVLNKRGFDINKLDFEDGKYASSNRSQNCDEKSSANGKGPKPTESICSCLRPKSQKNR